MKMKASVYDDFKSEFITLEEYQILKGEFDKKIAEAKETISRLQSSRNKVNAGLTEQQNWLAQFRQYENIQELNRRVVVSFVERIEISLNKEVCVTLINAEQFQANIDFLNEFQEKENAKKIVSLGKEVG